MIVKRIIGSLILLTLAGCGTTQTAAPSPTAVPIQTPTEEPTEEAMMSAGKILFEQFREEVGFACVTCHYVESDNRLLGPGLRSIETRFLEYDVEVESIESYIRQSILAPTEFITPADPPFPENIMPRTYADVFTDEQIDELIDYILSF